MILGDTNDIVGSGPTLDDLFRRVGVRHPEALALVDPPNRTSFAGDVPRQLTFAQADRAISALAVRLRGLGLATDSVVAIQLANTVESVIGLMGVLRAGMIAAPLPLLWRQQDIAAALSPIGAKAIITAARIGDTALAEVAMQAAAEVFPIRYVCGFGDALPDGTVTLDDIFAAGGAEFTPTPRAELAAAHVAVISFETGVDGITAVARNPIQLIAGGLAVFLETGMAEDAPLLSTIPLSSFAGFAVTLMPWLLGGGTLHLQHGFDSHTFAAQSKTLGLGTAILPGPMLPPLHDAGLLGELKSIVALWRASERLATAPPWRGEASLIDVACFGETGLVASPRRADGAPCGIRHGVIAAGREKAGSIPVIETARTSAGTLALRGAMVPAQPFPPGSEERTDKEGFIDTNLPCRHERITDTLTVTGPVPGLIGVGGYRFGVQALEMLVAESDPAATLIALPDALTGERLAGGAGDPAALRATLDARGVNPLVSGAFRPRKTLEAA